MVEIWGKIFFFLDSKLFSKCPVANMDCFHDEEGNASQQHPHSSYLTLSCSSLHIFSWPHCPSDVRAICAPCFSLGFPCKYPARAWVLAVFPDYRSHLSLLVYCHCCPRSGLCAGLQDPQPPAHCVRLPPPALPPSALHLFRPSVAPKSLLGSVYRASCYLDGFMKLCLWSNRE